MKNLAKLQHSQRKGKPKQFDDLFFTQQYLKPNLKKKIVEVKSELFYLAKL